MTRMVWMGQQSKAGAERALSVSKVRWFQRKAGGHSPHVSPFPDSCSAVNVYMNNSDTWVKCRTYLATFRVLDQRIPICFEFTGCAFWVQSAPFYSAYIPARTIVIWYGYDTRNRLTLLLWQSPVSFSLSSEIAFLPLSLSFPGCFCAPRLRWCSWDCLLELLQPW